MIIQSLCRYYERLQAEGDSDAPIAGYELQKVHFSLIIDRDGNLLQIRDLRDEKGKPRVMNLPSLGKKRTVGIEPFFAWDKSDYILGIAKIDPKKKHKPERIRQQFEQFITLNQELGNQIDDSGLQAVNRFLKQWQPDAADEHPAYAPWKDEVPGCNLVFELDQETGFIHESRTVMQAWQKNRGNQGKGVSSQCLISGKFEEIAVLHPGIKGVYGAQSTGASLVSFNLDAFCSYGKDQNLNAPVSSASAEAYAGALNRLLAFGSRQRIQIADATTVFWSERSSPMEDFMGNLLDTGKDEAGAAELNRFLNAVRSGKMPETVSDPDMSFYILGLAPNAARLAVRFWHVSSVAELCRQIGSHFADLQMVRQFEKDPEFIPLWLLLRETAAQGKSENIPPMLGGAMMRALLTGCAYPRSLYSAVMQRIRADHEINYRRASLLKACLQREARLLNRTERMIPMALDRENTNPGYRLGRLFATLEKAQKDANPGINATIRDRFYGAASATPRAVFPQLLRLAQHHIQKANGIYLDKTIGEIMQQVTKFPAHLSLDDQGMFAIGYYQQRQDFYTKKSESKEEVQ